MKSIQGGKGFVSMAMRRGAWFVALGAASLLAASCSTGPSDAPEEALGRTQEAIHDPAAPVCMAPQIPADGCCDFDLPNNVGPNASDKYSNTNDFVFLENLRARMPLFAPHSNPFTETDVFVASGWVRDDAALSGHGAVDYISTETSGDPSFPVRAVAPGQVITVAWDNFVGNLIVIEHTAPDGERYRSLYMHLRNGATNDCTNSKNFVATLGPAPTPPVTDPGDRLGRFHLFIDSQPDDCNEASLDDIVWGTNTMTIPVSPGDFVQGGEIIAEAGSTGYGGIGFGLDENGVPGGNANIHLHFSLAVHAPEAAPARAPTAEWITLDPYGGYGNVSAGCYALGAETEYKRLFAAFYPDFAGVTAEHLGHYFDYYPTMGLGLQSASFYPVPGDIHTAGSFQYGLSPVWATAIGVTQSDFDDFFDEAIGQGLQLREISATPIAGDAPRFTGIWTQRTATAGWGAMIQENDTEYAATRAQTIANGGRIADQFTYFDGATRMHASVQVFDGVTPTNDFFAQTLANFNATDAANQAAGLRPTSASAEPDPATTYGGVYVPAAGDWLVDADITGGLAGLQALYNTRAAEGRRIYRIQGHSNGDRFTIVWARNEVRPAASFVVNGTTTCTGPGGSSVTLNSSTTTFDPAFVIGYEWSGPFGVVTGANPVVTLPPGTHTINLRVFDSRGFESSTSRSVTIVQDTTPPVVVPPPALTITSCTGVNLGTATAVDACGGTITPTHNAPTKFPLGTTTVTWTAVDQYGNVGTATQLVTANLADDASCCPTGTNIIQGTSNNDTLNGTAGSDCILGKGAQDTINGNGGNDYISGGEGNDVINGNAGSDRLYGGSGQDILVGGSENDFLQGGSGDDECRGGLGNDEIRGGEHQDRLFGEAGNDALFGETGDDRLEGGDGNDALDGGGLHDVCLGGPGTDTFAVCQTQTQ
jgi:Ca2+-binding RTX toxin-like protein